LDHANNIAAARVAQAMQGVQTRLSSIENRTGMTFSAILMRAQTLEAAGAGKPADGLSFAQKYAEEVKTPKISGDPPVIEYVEPGAFESLPQSVYDELFTEAGSRFGIEAAIIKAVSFAESNFRPNAVSKAGAMGLMQLMPYTAEALGVDNPFDPWQNIDGGARLLAQNLDLYGGNALLAIAAYNCGRGGIDSRGLTDLADPYQRGQLPAETQSYLERIEDYLAAAQALHVLDSPYAV
jgi:soluble lytic murein transglycosylase-like protein